MNRRLSHFRGVVSLLVLVFLAGLQVGCLHFQRGPFDDEPGQATFVDVDDTRVRYIDVGQGPPVLLLHGFNATLNTWDPVIPALTENHRVLALDLRGFGYTDRPEGADYSPAGQADLVQAFLDNRGVDEVAVVAHSWGSSIALALALEAPQRVRRLALYSAWVFEEQLPTFFIWSRAPGVGEALFRLFYRERPADKMAMAFYDETIMTEELVDEVKQGLHRPGALAAALAAARAQRFEQIEGDYSQIDQPTLLLWGQNDQVTALSAGERLYTSLPDAELAVYPRCGHFPMIEARQPSTQRLVEFLADDSADASGGTP